MTFLIDIDGTILYSKKTKCINCDRISYTDYTPDKEEIKKVNELFSAGHTIILWTGRNWDCYDVTQRQLYRAGVNYNQLIMGKPQGIYIDKDSFQTIKEAKEKLDKFIKRNDYAFNSNA